REITSIIQPHIDLYHMLERAVGKSKNILDIGDDLLGLYDDIAGDDFTVDRRNLAGDIDEISCPDGLCEGATLAASLVVGDIETDQLVLAHDMFGLSLLSKAASLSLPS